MESELRRRIPWNQTVEEETPLLEEVELQELGAEEGITYAFETAEASGVLLDETGVGAPIGIAIGILAALGYGAYEIWQHLVDKGYRASKETIEHHIDHNPYKKLDLDISELKNQNVDFDYIPTEDQHRGLVPPPFKYLGPGNTLEQGIPYNEVDEDAREHDYSYNSYKTVSDIEESDKDFIKKSSDHFIEGLQGQGSISNTIGGALGAVGIGAKHLTEKLTGQLYPISGKL